jgi:hypothetical protein
LGCAATQPCRYRRGGEVGKASRCWCWYIEHTEIKEAWVSRRAEDFSSVVEFVTPCAPSVDGKDVDNHTQPNLIAFLEVAGETFDVGVDTLSAVNEDDYQVPFAFNGKIDKLIFKIGPSQLLPPDKKAAADADGKVND